MMYYDSLLYDLLTLLRLQSRFGDKALKVQVVCAQNGAAQSYYPTNNSSYSRTTPGVGSIFRPVRVRVRVQIGLLMVHIYHCQY